MKKLLSGIMALTIALSGLAAVTAAETEERVNLAAGAEVRFRPYQYESEADDLPANGSDADGNGGYVAEYAIDGDESTVAIPSGSYQTSVWLDLKDVYKVNEVDVLYSQRGEMYEIYVSENNTSWFKPVNVTNGTRTLEDVTEEVNISPRNVRYVLIRSRSWADEDAGLAAVGQGVREIRVYADENIAANATIELQQRDGTKIEEANTAYLTDGAFVNGCGPYIDTVNTAATYYTWNAHLTLDKEYFIDRVGMVIRASNGDSEFCIETSVDGVNYTSRTNLKVTGSTARPTDGSNYFQVELFEPVEAKYIRIKELTSVHSWGIIVTELNVFAAEKGKTNVATSASNVSVTYSDGTAATANNHGIAGLTDGYVATYCGVTGNTENDSSNPYAWNVTLELDKAYAIDEVRVAYYLNKVVGGVFDIETSTDGVNYTKKGSFTTDGTQTAGDTRGNYKYSVSIDPSVAKYVRIKDSSNSHPYTGYIISEIGVYESDSTKKLYVDTVSYDINDTKIDKLQKGDVTVGINVYTKGEQEVVIITGLFDRYTNELIKANKAEYDVNADLVNAEVTLSVDKEIPARVSYVTSDCTAALRNQSNTEDQNANMSVNGEGGYKAEYVCDGDTATYAMGSGTYEGAVVLELTETKNIGQIDVLFERVTPDYDILVSEDGVDYTLVKNVTDDEGSGLRSFMVSDQNAKYIMVRNNSTTKTQGIYEIYAYEPASRYELRTFLWDSVEGMLPLSDVNVLGN